MMSAMVLAMMIGSCGTVSAQTVNKKLSTTTKAPSAKTTTTAGTTATAATADATTTTTTTTTPASQATTYGQGAGAAIMNLYAQYKADGKFDMKNANNILNSLQLFANCIDLKDNYKDKTYLSEYGLGLMKGAAGLVNTDNVESVLSNLTELANSKAAEASETASNALTKAAAVAAGANNINNLLGLFINK